MSVLLCPIVVNCYSMEPTPAQEVCSVPSLHTTMLIASTESVDGLANFVRHFIVKRGVSEGLFEGKLTNLVAALEKR